METAILVMLIVALIILLALTFFVFQIWFQSKETKLQINNFVQEIQKGFANNDNNIKDAIEKLTLTITTETKQLLASNENIKDQLKDNSVEIKKTKDEISQNVNSRLDASELKINFALESFKTSTGTNIGELSDSVKLFKDHVEERIKELDKHFSEKLVYDLTELTKKYSDELATKNTESFNKFNSITTEYVNEVRTKHQDIFNNLVKTGREYTEELKQKHQDTTSKLLEISKKIQEEQNVMLKAITDPLQIKH